MYEQAFCQVMNGITERLVPWRKKLSHDLPFVTLTSHQVLPPVQVQLDEGSLVMSCNGITEMDIVLKLEATHGLGLDKFTALHTLVLSNNQLQVSIPRS